MKMDVFNTQYWESRRVYVNYEKVCNKEMFFNH